MMTKHERPSRTPGAHDARRARSADFRPNGRSDLDRAIAEAARRERARRGPEGQGDPPDNPDDSNDPSFYCIDSFELAPATCEDPARVCVLVVERVGAARQARSSAELVGRFGLTRREAEVAAALAGRLSSAEIAAALGISVNTARRHSERVLEKLGIRSRREISTVLRERNE
jgi:DNA-binding CsgD family transcriptional regulator